MADQNISLSADDVEFEKPQAHSLSPDDVEFEKPAKAQPSAPAPANVGTISPHAPSLLERIESGAHQAVDDLKQGHIPFTQANFPGTQTASHLADVVGPQPIGATDQQVKESQVEGLKAAAADVTGARGYGQMAGAAKKYAGTIKRDLSGEAYQHAEDTAAEREQAGTEFLGGAMEAATPLVPISAAAAPIRTAAAIGTGLLTGKGARYVAGKAGAGEDVQNLAEATGQFVPSALGVAAGVKEFGGTQGDVKFGGASALDNRAGVMGAVSPEGAGVGVKVGDRNIQFSVGKNPIQDAADVLARRQLSEAQVRSAASGQAPPPVAPEAGQPEVISPKKVHITDADVKAVTDHIEGLPENERGDAIIEAQEKLATLLRSNGKTVMPNGRIVRVSTPEDADAAATEIINKATEQAEKQRAQAEKEAPKQPEVAPQPEPVAQPEQTVAANEPTPHAEDEVEAIRRGAVGEDPELEAVRAKFAEQRDREAELARIAAERSTGQADPSQIANPEATAEAEHGSITVAEPQPEASPESLRQAYTEHLDRNPDLDHRLTAAAENPNNISLIEQNARDLSEAHPNIVARARDIEAGKPEQSVTAHQPEAPAPAPVQTEAERHLAELDAQIAAKQKQLDRHEGKVSGGYTAEVAKHFPLGTVGGSGKNVRSLNARRSGEIERTIDAAKKATEASKELDALKVRRERYAAGKIDEQGKRIVQPDTPETLQKKIAFHERALKDGLDGKPLDVLQKEYSQRELRRMRKELKASQPESEAPSIKKGSRVRTKDGREATVRQVVNLGGKGERAILEGDRKRTYPVRELTPLEQAHAAVREAGLEPHSHQSFVMPDGEPTVSFEHPDLGHEINGKKYATTLTRPVSEIQSADDVHRILADKFKAFGKELPADLAAKIKALTPEEAGALSAQPTSNVEESHAQSGAVRQSESGIASQDKGDSGTVRGGGDTSGSTVPERVESPARPSADEPRALATQDNQALFTEGAKIVEKRMGSEVRDFDRVLQGVASVAEAHGIKPIEATKPSYYKAGEPHEMYHELGSLFHDPLATISPKTPIAQIADAMSYRIGGGLSFEQQQMEKGGLPYDLREPQKMADRDMSLSRYVNALERAAAPSDSLKTFGGEIANLRKQAVIIRHKADIVEALGGNAERIAEGRKQAGEFDQIAKDSEQRIQKKIEDAERQLSEHRAAVQNRPVTNARELQPLDNLKTNIRRQWSGNHVVQDSTWASDGHTAIDTFQATKAGKKKAEQIKKAHEKASGVHADAIERLVETMEKSAKNDAELLGYRTPSESLKEKTPLAYFADKKGTVVPVDAEKLKLIYDTVAPDSMKIGGPEKGVVFYKNGDPAALLMPIRMSAEDAIDVATARGAQKGEAKEAPVAGASEGTGSAGSEPAEAVKPTALYHGSPTKGLKELRRDKAAERFGADPDGKGIYVSSDRATAESYSDGGDVYRVHATPEHILDVAARSSRELDPAVKASVVKVLRSAGYDTTGVEFAPTGHDLQKQVYRAAGSNPDGRYFARSANDVFRDAGIDALQNGHHIILLGDSYPVESLSAVKPDSLSPKEAARQEFNQKLGSGLHSGIPLDALPAGLKYATHGVKEAAKPLSELISSKADKVREAKELQSGLYDLDSMYSADVLRGVKFLEQEGLGSAADQEAVYHSLEDSSIHLTAKQERIRDLLIKPLMDEAERINEKLNPGGSVENYVHRIVKDSGSLLDRLLTNSRGKGGNKLSKYASATKGRTMMAAVTPDGERVVVSVKGGEAYANGESLGTVKQDDLGRYVSGKDGSEYRLQQATTKEIEAHTPLEYYKNAAVSAVTNFLEMRKAERAFDFVQAQKEELLKNGSAVQIEGRQKAPEGFRTTKLPQMQGIHFEPHIADVLDWYADKLTHSPNAWDKVGQFLRTSIFFNPLLHIPNIANHWVVEKGTAAYLAPSNYKTAWQAGVKAVDAVIHQNQDFLDALDAGAPLQSQQFQTRQIGQVMLDAMSKTLENPTEASKIAKALGYANPAKLVKAWYELSGKATWFANDLFYLQATYEKTAKGMSLKQALTETGKHIPDYRVPVHILGSKAVSKLMTNPNIAMFGAYHYGALKSYGEMVKEVAGGKGKTGKGLDHLLMLGAMTFLIYPLLDQLVKKATGDDKAELRRAGASTFVNNAWQLYKGEKNPVDFATSIVTPAAHTKLGIELASNHDLRTGRQIYNPHADTKTIARQVEHRIGDSVGPAGQVQRANEQGVKKTLLGMAGVSFPKHGAQKVASEIAASKFGTEAEDPDARDKRVLRLQIIDALRKGDSAPLNQARAKGQINGEDAFSIRKAAHEDPLLHTVKSFTYDEIQKVYRAANEDERKKLAPLMMRKRAEARLKSRTAVEQ